MSSETDSVLLEAQKLVYGDRAEAYGPPTEDFRCAADMASAYFKRKYPGFPDLKPEDIPAFMVCIKMARQAHKPKRDNLVDLAGYTGCWARVVHGEPPALPAPTPGQHS